MDCGMVGDMHPKEMIIDNISSQQCNEAYTVIKLPASASSKGTASVCVKIDTGSGGNILLLCLFQQLHPKQTSPDGLPIGLDPVQTKLTAYNGSPYSPVWNPLWPHPLATKHSWSPTMHDPLILVHHRHTWSCSPGPPSMREVSCGPSEWCCQDHSTNRSVTGTTPTQAARATKPPTARTSKSKCIKSTDDLMREFPDRFTGIGKFPGEYKIQLHPDAHLVIHAPRKCPIALCSKVKEHLAKKEALGVITHVDQPRDWVSSITYV